jgi:hypothetical protein
MRRLVLAVPSLAFLTACLPAVASLSEEDIAALNDLRVPRTLSHCLRTCPWLRDGQPTELHVRLRSLRHPRRTSLLPPVTSTGTLIWRLTVGLFLKRMRLRPWRRGGRHNQRQVCRDRTEASRRFVALDSGHLQLRRAASSARIA